MGDKGLELELEAVETRGVFGFQNLQLFSRLLGQPRLERHAPTEMTWWLLICLLFMDWGEVRRDTKPSVQVLMAELEHERAKRLWASFMISREQPPFAALFVAGFFF